VDKEIRQVDPLLYNREPLFGVAGGPIVVRLTLEGRHRTFSVANNMKLTRAEFVALERIAAYGTLGCNVDGFTGDAIYRLMFRKLIELRYDRFLVTAVGEAMLDRAAEEERHLIERIKEEEKHG
jgi:hypothetical protein